MPEDNQQPPTTLDLYERPLDERTAARAAKWLSQVLQCDFAVGDCLGSTVARLLDSQFTTADALKREQAFLSYVYTFPWEGAG